MSAEDRQTAPNTTGQRETVQASQLEAQSTVRCTEVASLTHNPEHLSEGTMWNRNVKPVPGESKEQPLRVGEGADSHPTKSAGYGWNECYAPSSTAGKCWANQGGGANPPVGKKGPRGEEVGVKERAPLTNSEVESLMSFLNT